MKALINRLEKTMKKRDLLKYFDESLLDKLFGFCYARTNDSYEADELCSDIVYALAEAANQDGEIENVYPESCAQCLCRLFGQAKKTHRNIL